VLCHEHVAILHRGDAPASRAAEYLREGLERGQWCCGVVPAAVHADLRAHLAGLGLDVGKHLAARTLHLPPVAQGPRKLIEWAQRLFAEAEAARAPALRWLEEGVWAPPSEHRDFFALHARWNYFVKEYPSVAVCQYNAERMDSAALLAAIAVHRHLIVEGTLVRDNPFYIPPEKFLALGPEERERDLRSVFREVGFDGSKLLSLLAGYGQLQRP
jgi:hypothetical protein